MKNSKETFQELVAWTSFRPTNSPQHEKSLFILRDVNLKRANKLVLKKKVCKIYMLEIIVAF